MPRGRPKKAPTVEPTDLEGKIAELLTKSCSIPGCVPKHHLEDARKIVVLSRAKDDDI